MSDRMFTSLKVWFNLSIVVGLGGGVIWAIIFWNNDDLYMYHWMSVPLAMLIMLVGAIRSWRLR